MPPFLTVGSRHWRWTSIMRGEFPRKHSAFIAVQEPGNCGFEGSRESGPKSGMPGLQDG